jgi:hypothetical protein
MTEDVTITAEVSFTLTKTVSAERAAEFDVDATTRGLAKRIAQGYYEDEIGDSVRVTITTEEN